MTRHILVFSRFLSLLGTIATTTMADDPEAQLAGLLQGAASGEVSVLQQVLPGADPNGRDANGRTALMIAAEGGHFDAVRFLLWQGADANLIDPEGKTAVQLLAPGENGYGPLNLLIRSHAFVQSEADPGGAPAHPHLVLVNDNFIDYQHPDLRKSYKANGAEEAGLTGKDDDGNGFVDDVYGWNSEDDAPVRPPFLSVLRDEANRQFLTRVLAEREETVRRLSGLPPESRGAADQAANPLSGSYDNPIVRDFGLVPLMENGFDINDFAFAQMIYSASHGTHVAGIAVESSRGKARIHAMTHGPRRSPKLAEWDNWDWVSNLAANSETYTDFVASIRQRIVGRATAKGKRSAAYIKATGAGVVNMSYARNRGYFVGLAQRIQEVYGDAGKNPDTMLTHVCPIGVDLCSDLALELAVADAAEFALVMAENPNVLFVMAAGNEDANNDVELPSPTYLSRFFPNAITVASIDASDNISGFSNYGLRSVQVAAPGEEIESALIGGNRGQMDGTSMAAPAVAGIAAFVRSEYPTLSAADLRRILERSSRRVKGLEEWIDSGGIVDADAALAMAEAWRPGLEPLTENELARMSRGTVDEEGPADSPASRPSRRGGRLEIGGGLSETSWRITTHGGYSGGWRFMMSQGSVYEKQVVLPASPSPWETVDEYLAQGYEITSLAGDSGAWSVVMSAAGEGAGREQILLPYDQTALQAAQESGYRITSVSGWKDNWTLILTAGTGGGPQRYTRPSAFDESRKTWINDRFAEGYRITNVAGDEVGEGEEGSWIVVMTRDSGLGDQVYSGVGPWPQEWIDEQTERGFRTSAVAGYEDHWIVVMTDSTRLGGQEVRESGEIPGDWIREKWAE